MLCLIYIVEQSVVRQSVVMHIVVAPLEEVIEEKNGIWVVLGALW
jgi:hypothetical protein